MLCLLSIRDLGLIESADIEFGEGLQIITGETGVGKSMLLRSFTILAGGRAKADWIRDGVDEARISAVFELDVDLLTEELRDYLELGSGIRELHIERRLRRAGRHRAYVDGSDVPVQILAKLCAELIEFSGQREQLTLLQPARQLDLVDRFAGLEADRDSFRAQRRELLELVRQLVEARTRAGDRVERRLLVEHLLTELDEADLRVGEKDELERELQLLEKSEQIAGDAAAALEDLYDGEESCADRLSRHLAALEPHADLHPLLGEFRDSATAASSALEETARVLRSALDEVDREPERLAVASERFDAILRLEERHRRSEAELIAYRDELTAEFAELTELDEGMPDREARAAGQLDELERLGRRLTRRRRAAAKQLDGLVGEHLSDLRLGRARIAFEVSAKEGGRSTEGVIDSESEATAGRLRSGAGIGGLGPELERISTALERYDDTGGDDLEIVFEPNPGEHRRPLREIASGGELSRVKLAIERVLVEADKIPTVVFDEIDSGVGGRVGTAIGRKLRELGQARQVICVTHLPQVASFGHRHFRVSKSVAQGRTKTMIDRLSAKAVEAEIAQMIGGEEGSKVSRAQALELLDVARTESESA